MHITSRLTRCTSRSDTLHRDGRVIARRAAGAHPEPGRQHQKPRAGARRLQVLAVRGGERSTTRAPGRADDCGAAHRADRRRDLRERLPRQCVDEQAKFQVRPRRRLVRRTANARVAHPARRRSGRPQDLRGRRFNVRNRIGSSQTDPGLRHLDGDVERRAGDATSSQACCGRRATGRPHPCRGRHGPFRAIAILRDLRSEDRDLDGRRAPGREAVVRGRRRARRPRACRRGTVDAQRRVPHHGDLRRGRRPLELWPAVHWWARTRLRRRLRGGRAPPLRRSRLLDLHAKSGRADRAPARRDSRLE